MVMIALCSSLIGAVLGTRLRVLVLFPATILGLLLIATVAAIQGLTVPSTIGAGIAMTICLQLGYLGGLFTRFCLAANRAVSARPSGSSLKAAD